ncbi:MAG: hypothetical protein ACR2RE_08025 [Geminicoccaceae bacterium]
MTSPYLDRPLRTELEGARDCLELLRSIDRWNENADNTYAISGKQAAMRRRIMDAERRIRELEAGV